MYFHLLLAETGEIYLTFTTL